MRLKIFTCCLAGLTAPTITSATYAQGVVMYQQVTDNKPDVGVSTTVYLGDRMLQQRHGQYQECIVPKFDLQKSMNLGMARFIVQSGKPICKISPEENYYTPNYINWIGGSDVRSTYNVALVDKGDGFLNICIVSMGVKSGCTKDKRREDYESEPYFVYSINSLQQL